MAEETSWVVMGGEGVLCRRCGATQALTIPAEVSELCAELNRFRMAHRQCNEAASCRVQCPTCGGAGQVGFRVHFPLHTRVADHLYSTGPKSAVEVQQAFAAEGLCQSTYNNRLEKLRTYGLAERRREGRDWIYSLTTAGRRLAEEGLS